MSGSHRRNRLGRGLLLLGVAAAMAPVAMAGSSQTHVTSFKAAGGDATYGNGDNSVVTLVQGFFPLFDVALGSLQRVDLEISAWRRLDFSCTQMPVGSLGSCNAGVSANFVMDGINYPVWSFLTMLVVSPQSSQQTTLSPGYGETLSASVYAEAVGSASFTDALQLQRHFSNATGIAPWVDYRLYFQGQDGGSIGQGGNAGISSLFWDADATMTLTYHYQPAVVPEPATQLLLAAGLLALVLRNRRR